MKPFFIVGPTASGKSDLAAEVASRTNAEVVGADAYQIYRGLDLLTAKPEPTTLARVPHHLIGAVPLAEEMSALRFGELAAAAIAGIHAREKNVIVVGGSGLYLRALTEGFSPMPAANWKLRERLAQHSLGELHTWLRRLDPETAHTIDAANPRRVARAVEICLTSGKPASSARKQPTRACTDAADGVFVFRDREELYCRIDARVREIFARGVVDEVRGAEGIGATAGQTLGLREIRQLLAGEIREAECIAAMQQATRRYAKRQLTWFRRQSNFELLNLSERTAAEAIEVIERKARLPFAHD